MLFGVLIGLGLTLEAGLASAAEGRVAFSLPRADQVDFVRVYVGLSPRMYETSLDLMRARLSPTGMASVIEPALARVLSEPRIYYVALTSVDTSGRESGFSNELQVDLRGPGRTAPAPTPRVGNKGPALAVRVDGATPRDGLSVAADAPVQLSVEASDPDGLGFPVFQQLGSNAPITYLWSFGGGLVANPLAVFTASPVVRFPLGSGQTRRDFSVSVVAFDALGARSEAKFSVRAVATTRASLVVFADGAEVAGSGPVRVRSGQTVRFVAQAVDPDGLGFPVFQDLGIPTPFAYIWDFGGARPQSTLEVFTADPQVRFDLARGESARTYRMSVVVYDSKGTATTYPINVRVTR